MAIGIELTWVRPTIRADGSTLAVGDISKYIIEYGVPGASLASLDITDNTAISHDLAPLTDGVTYRVRISVVDTAGLTSQLSGFVYGVAAEIGVVVPPDTGITNLLTDSFNTLALTLDNPQNTPEPDGATLTIDSNSDAGTLYSYSKTTAFTGTDEENAAEIMANGVGQAPVVGTNTRVVTGQDQLTPYYAGWVQDSEGYGADMVLVFNMGAGETLTIPGGAGAYLFDIDWGDGTVETGLTTQGAGPHTYTDARPEAVVRISGVFPHVYFNNVGDTGKLIRILNWGDTSWSNANAAFFGASNLVEVSSEVANTSAVTDMYAMMRDWTSMLSPPDLSSWDTSSVTNMNAMMYNWSSMLSPPDLSSFDTSAVTNMFAMMNNWPAMLSPPDLSSFDTSSVTNMYAMMYNWSSMGAIDIPIDTWNIGLVTDFSSFLQDTQLTTACYDRTLASWGNQTLVNTTDIHFGNSKWSDGVAKQAMIDAANGFLIIDGGEA